MWAVRCTPSVFNFPFSLDVKERFGSIDETKFLDRLDAELSSGTDFLLYLERVDGPLEEEGSRPDTATDEIDSVASVDFPCFVAPI
jgi:hypothetical protein